MNEVEVELGQGEDHDVIPHLVELGQVVGHDVIQPLNQDLTKILKIPLVKNEILKYLDGPDLINLSMVKEFHEVVTSSNAYKVALGQGQGQEGQHLQPLNLAKILNIDLIKEVILKYLDVSALLNLSLVNKGSRHLVTSYKGYREKINLKVTTKSMDFSAPTASLLPPLADNLAHLTISCNSELALLSPKRFSALTQTLPNLSTLVLVNDFKSYIFASTFLDKILNLSSNLKSLSLPYDFLLNPINFNHFGENLQELKLTTSNYNVNFDTNFEENLKILATKCINLKSFTCQELIILDCKYYYDYDEGLNYIINGILTIIENNSDSLEKLEFGISQMIFNTQGSQRFLQIAMPKLKYLDLRLVKNPLLNFVNDDLELEIEDIEPPILDILNNLPQHEQLTTLKLTITSFPSELFDLIPQKFPQLKRLSLKASKYPSIDPILIMMCEESWTFLPLLIKLEELEITKFLIEKQTSNFGFKIFDKFPVFLQNNNLRKLCLKGGDQVDGSTFCNGIVGFRKLKELAITGSSIYLDDFMTICGNFKDLEKLEISTLLADKLNSKSSDVENNEIHIDYSEILTAFLSLKCLKELSIEVLSGDFRGVLGYISFPYLKSLTLCNSQLDQNELLNLIKMNRMLKEFFIISLKEEGDVELDQNVQFDNFGIAHERNNLKIEFSSKIVRINPDDDNEKAREDSDPDSKPIEMQKVFLSDWQ